MSYSDCKSKVKNLQEITKIYLMATDGSTERLGLAACTLMDVSDRLCGADFEGASQQLDDISITLIKVIYQSVFERLLMFDDHPGFRAERLKLESEAMLLPHVLFLKTILADLSETVETNHYEAISQKVEELVNVIGS